MSQNEAKYPVEKAKGKSDKYTKLQCVMMLYVQSDKGIKRWYL